MSVTLKAEKTTRFIEPGVYLAFAAVVLVLLSALFSGFFQRTVVSENLSVEPESTAVVESIPLKRSPVGAMRIKVKAVVPTNRWVTYEIQLLDAEGETIASALKDAWKESGTWYEDGESGTWQEQDLLGGLDVQASEKKEQIVDLAIAVLEYTNTKGEPINQSVSFKVTVKKGTIDTRYLWAGFFGTISLAILSIIGLARSGKLVLSNTVNDSDIGDRGMLGGPDKLVKVTVEIQADETSPRELTINLWVKDGEGEQICHQTTPVRLRFIKDEDGEIQRTIGKHKYFFVFEKRGSYGFYVEVTPDQPVDRTKLFVREGVRTLTNFEVLRVNNR